MAELTHLLTGRVDKGKGLMANPRKGSAAKSFSDIVMNGEMIENAIRSGKIDAEESNRRKVTANQSGSSRQESRTRQSTEKLQFTPIVMSYKEPYQRLFDAHVVASHYLKPLQLPYPNWYDASAQCDYHVGTMGHSIENCIAFKKLVEKLIGMGVVKLDDSPNAEDPLPNHNEVNMMSGNMGRNVKTNVVEKENYCEFHQEIGHEIQDCTEFKTLVQGMIDNKETEFYEEVQEEENICALKLTAGVPKANYPVVIISRPKNSEARTCITPKIIIQKLATFPYKDRKETSAAMVEGDQEPTKEGSSTEKQKREKAIVPEPLINEPIQEEEAKEFLKFLKHSEYSVVEQLHKQPVRISVLALLLSSEAHRSALMKVLNETYVANDISVNKLDRLVNNISADNFIFFNDDEIPPGGRGSTKALHITTRCKGYTLPRVLIDNGSALNVLPLSTLDKLPWIAHI
ncbi:uncharacterized protein [Gossypium hirsutum]|uniref:Retrotransposon gag protein n=1 Tax=Gossypium hirsutum TaxID=3635 RepID=A0A1U8JK44_GOSHI|nr:uncharacterized protein LOC107907859 [Gossypium hirsutum]